MRSVVLLGFLWTASILGLISASAVSKCLDGSSTCSRVRAIVQGPDDVNEVLEKHERALEVDFHGNLLESYQHPSIAQWKKMNLSYNLLKEDMFRNIRHNHLDAIDLTYNQLKTVSIPSSVTEFIAERNQLHGITFGWNSGLQKLILPKNQFQSLDKFKSLSNLKELDLSCNDLSELKLDHLPESLHTLKLARNHIYSISGSQTLQSLEYLDLSHNILTMFTVVQVFPSVRNLYLQNNKIVMWMDESKIANEFQQLNLNDNDWDCKNLEKVLKKAKGRRTQMIPSRNSSCKPEYDYICCTSTDAPYADRLIKYRKQEFKALNEGTALREGNNASCTAYKPNPCDGDDNLVYEVAGSAAKDAKSLAESSLQELDGKLKQEQNVVKFLQKNVTNFEAQNKELSKEQSDLVTYIAARYKEALPLTEQSLNGQKDQEVAKLQQLFDYYAKENDNLKQQITAEERNNRDKLDEVNTLEREMQDLNYQKDRLMEEINRRNATVEDYKRKIQTLQTKLQG